MADLFTSFAQATTVEIETAISPPIRVRLSDQLGTSEGPGLVARLLRPKVTLRSGEAVLFRVEPAGAPDERLRALILVGLSVSVALALMHVTSR